ncbi:MAG: hypothetical protein FWC61_02345 [Proteobacteria bacterium]|nr:hypothetical protein [Pseudomonadota bacterium]
MKKISLLFAGCLLVSACALQTKERGYIFPDGTDTKLAAVKTTGDLEQSFGSPAAKTIYGKPVWIYYGADEGYRGPFPLTWDNRRVLLAWVDPPPPGGYGAAGGRVIQTKILKDSDLPNVDIVGGATPIPAEIRLNAFQELINNVGRFTPSGLGQ